MLNKAIELANNMSYQKYKICSIITNKKDHILSIGFNSFTKTHPKQLKYAKNISPAKIFLHSEISAIVNLPFNAKPVKIYIARVNQNNRAMLAKPCQICASAIKDVGIKEVYHT